MYNADDNSTVQIRYFPTHLNPSMKPKACLIFNPVAGQGDSEQDLETIESILSPEFDLQIKFTTPETDADQLAKEAIASGIDYLIASGGDGTLSAAATAVIATDIPLGIISRGTANAFAAALGIPDTITAACKTIVQGYAKKVDVATCNGRPMVLLAGIGFEAETVEKASREAKNRFGVLAYVFAGISQLREFQTFEVEIETEDKIIKTSASAVTVANAAPKTSVLAQGPAGIIPDDGLLDLTIVAPQNVAGAVAASYHLFQTASSSAPVERDDIGYLRAKKFKVTTEPPQKVVVDGEIIGTTPIEVECIPGGLNILTPIVEEEIPTEKLDGLPNLVVEMKED